MGRNDKPFRDMNGKIWYPHKPTLINWEDIATRRLELLVRAMNALEGWRILLDMPITDIMIDIEKELPDAVGSKD